MPKRRIITAIIHLHLSAAGENGHYSQSVQAQKEIFVYLGILLSYMLLFKVICGLIYLTSGTPGTYHEVASSWLSRLVANLRIFRLFMKGKFDAYVL